MSKPVRLTGQIASEGYAEGPIWFASPAAAIAYRRKPDAEAERAALAAAIAAGAAETAEMVAAAEGDAAEILEFQLAMLEDDTFATAANDAIDSGAGADRAWQQVLDAEIAGYAASDNEYFRARSADLADIRNRVLASLRGETRTEIPAGTIYLAEDITPSAFLGHDWTGGGLALTAGSATGHVAMLARQRGIPAIVGLGEARIASGLPALLDGGTGALIVSPDAATLAAFAASRRRFAEARSEAAQFLPRPAVTADGTPIAVHVNISVPADTDDIPIAHVDGVGLMRTEFLFAHGLPDEETQYLAYRAVLEWAGDKPVIIRTADAGGDKPVPGYTIEESNPFLGTRGIRLSLARPEIFSVQIRALLRAAAHGNLKVMLPMVSVPEEIDQAAALFAREAGALAAAKTSHRLPDLGIMVEVPSVALTPHRFAKAAFFSIGSNDLAQYTLAASRDSARLASIARSDDPAVLALIERTAAFGAARGIPVSLCGDAASDPALVPHLLRAGMRSLSVAASRIGVVKAAIAATSLGS